MPNESRKLSKAREQLAAVETDFLGEVADYHIEEAFALLEKLMMEKNGAESPVARNLGESYFARLRALLVEQLAHPSLPEPTLKRLMRLAQALESSQFAKGSDLETLRQTAARRLLDKYLDGYSAQEKERQIQILMDRLKQQGSFD